MDKLKKRAKRKYINSPFISALIEQGGLLTKSYWSTVACSSVIAVKDDKPTATYCKQRWCTVCGSIKTAVRINTLLPVLESAKITQQRELYFTTLTVPNVDIMQLAATCKKFKTTLRQYADQLRKDGCPLYAIYNIETTINYTTGLYHPHIHILHFDKLDIKKHWKKTFPKISNKGQCANKETYDLQEIFKYNTKPISTIDLTKIKSNEYKFNLEQIIEKFTFMYEALKGSRLFGAYGFHIPKIENEDKEMDELTAQTTEKESGVYNWQVHDWISESGETLADYIPNKKQINYVDKFSNNKENIRPMDRPKIESGYSKGILSTFEAVRKKTDLLLDKS